MVLTVDSFDSKGNPLDENKQLINTNNIKVGVSSVLLCPQGGDIKFINPNAAIDQLINVIDYMVEKLYTTSHVPKVTLAPSDTIASGISLIVRWYPLVGLLNKKRSSFRVSEEELVRKTLLVHERASGRTNPLPDYAFTVNFDEGTVPKSMDEQITEDRFELEIGATSVVDYLLRKDPDLTEEEAIEKLKKNEEINRELLSIRSKLATNEEKTFDQRLSEIENK